MYYIFKNVRLTKKYRFLLHFVNIDIHMNFYKTFHITHTEISLNVNFSITITILNK